jgi:hypothetical protein
MAKKRIARRKTSRKEIKPIETRSFVGRDDARRLLLATAALLDQDQDFVVAVVFARMQGEVGGHFKANVDLRPR